MRAIGVKAPLSFKGPFRGARAQAAVDGAVNRLVLAAAHRYRRARRGLTFRGRVRHAYGAATRAVHCACRVPSLSWLRIHARRTLHASLTRNSNSNSSLLLSVLHEELSQNGLCRGPVAFVQ